MEAKRVKPEPGIRSSRNDLLSSPPPTFRKAMITEDFMPESKNIDGVFGFDVKPEIQELQESQEPQEDDAYEGPSSSMIRESRKRTIVSREAYDAFVTEMTAKKEILEDPNASTQVLADTIAQLDNLYENYVDKTVNTRIIETDQHAFRKTAEAILERMKNQSRGVPGEITAELFLSTIEKRVDADGEKFLNSIGAYFVRQSHVVSLPTPAPSLESAERRKGTVRRAAIAKPTEEAKTAGDIDEDEFSVERIQNVIQQNIAQYVLEDENANNYEPISLYELCYNKDSFVLTLENMFFTSVLIKEKRLWLGADEHGMPVVGTAINRQKYVDIHPDDACGPQIDFNNEKHKDRFQFNWNFNKELYDQLKAVYKDEDPLIPRDPYEE